jgi:threonine dehydratase
MTSPFPDVPAIRENRARLGELVLTTSVRRVRDDAISTAIGDSTELWLKEELFQYTGSFKPRGALSVMLRLSEEALARGVTGVSAGNHAMALAFAARTLGTTATVVMPRTANAFRIQRCRELGATVELVDTIADAFARVRAIEAAEGRTFVHPFEGPYTALGTAGVGLEFIEQTAAHGVSLDAVIVAAGGLRGETAQSHDRSVRGGADRGRHHGPVVRQPEAGSDRAGEHDR